MSERGAATAESAKEQPPPEGSSSPPFRFLWSSRAVKELMTVDVVCCHRFDPIVKAAQKMRAHDVGLLPVVEEGNVVGVLTDRDIALRYVAQGDPLYPEDVRVDSCMTQDVVSLGPEEPVEAALQLMAEHSVRRVLVMDGRTLLGIISLDDVLRRGEHAGEVASVVASALVRTMARDWE